MAAQVSVYRWIPPWYKRLWVCSLKAMSIVLLGHLIHSIGAQVPKHSVGSELRLHKNRHKVIGSLLALQVFSWNSQGAFSFEGDLGVWFHLGWVEWYLLLLFGKSSKYRHDSGLEGIWGGIPLGNSLQLKAGKHLEQYLRMGKRREHNFQCRGESWLCLAVYGTIT